MKYTPGMFSLFGGLLMILFAVLQKPRNDFGIFIGFIAFGSGLVFYYIGHRRKALKKFGGKK